MWIRWRLYNSLHQYSVVDPDVLNTDFLIFIKVKA